MRILQVTAESFGPLESATLGLGGPGLRIVTGPNESGKSTWHAAIYAALCGRPVEWDDRTRAFGELNRGRWVVSAEIEFGDRHIALRQDLVNPEASTAYDLATHEDVSGEIRRPDGRLDAAVWFGLDAISFAATAWVAQGTLMRDLGGQHLQRAVARAEGDGTAATALDALARYAGGFGPDDIASVKPLGLALQSVHRARRRLTEAERKRAEHHQSANHIDELKRVEHAAGSRLAAAIAHHRERQAAAQRKALQWSSVNAPPLGTAQDNQINPDTPPVRLSEQPGEIDPNVAAGDGPVKAAAYPESAIPVTHAQNTVEIPTAADGWPSTDFPPQSYDIAVPAVEGDLAPDEDVESAARQLEWTEDRHRAAEDEVADALRLEEQAELLLTVATRAEAVRREDRAARDADALRDKTAIHDAALRRIADLRRQAIHAEARVTSATSIEHNALLLAIGATIFATIAAVATTVLFIVSDDWFARIMGMMVTGFSAAVAGGALVVRRLSGGRAARRELADLTEQLADADADAQAALDDLRALQEQLAAGAGAAPPEANPAYGQRTEATAKVRRARQEAAYYAGLVDTARDRLRSALRDRGVDVDRGGPADPVTALADYREACAGRAELARQRAEQARQAAIAAAARATAEREAALREAELREAAAHQAALHAAAQAEADRLAEAEAARLAAELETTRLAAERANGGSVRGMTTWSTPPWNADGGWGGRIDSIVDGAPPANFLTDGFDGYGEGDDHGLDDGWDGDAVDLVTLRTAYEDAKTARMEAEREEYARRRVVEAESPIEDLTADLDQARAQLSRLRGLHRTARRAYHHLAEARRSVHEELVVMVESMLDLWLPRITDGLYTKAALDNDTLAVRIRDSRGRWDDATHGSYGLTEQVALLQRLALVRYFCTRPGSVPLVLDEATVNADPERTRRLLDVLLQLSEDHQIILFCQETDVTTWAHENGIGTVDLPRPNRS